MAYARQQFGNITSNKSRVYDVIIAIYYFCNLLFRININHYIVTYSWSFRGFDINEIGVCDLMLPSSPVSSGSVSMPSSLSATMIAHVDVRIASPKDMCSVIVFISIAGINDETSHTSISIKNESDEIVTVNQVNFKTNQSIFQTYFLNVFDINDKPFMYYFQRLM